MSNLHFSQRIKWPDTYLEKAETDKASSQMFVLCGVECTCRYWSQFLQFTTNTEYCNKYAT